MTGRIIALVLSSAIALLSTPGQTAQGSKDDGICFIGGKYTTTFLMFVDAIAETIIDDDPCNGDKHKQLTNLAEWHCLCKGEKVYEQSKYRRD